jgi:hypothetical protein
VSWFIAHFSNAFRQKGLPYPLRFSSQTEFWMFVAHCIRAFMQSRFWSGVFADLAPEKSIGGGLNALRRSLFHFRNVSVVICQSSLFPMSPESHWSNKTRFGVPGFVGRGTTLNNYSVT